MNIRLEKISTSSDPNAYAAADWKDYKIGEINTGLSVPIDYNVEGQLIDDLKIGHSIKMSRTKRNDVVCDGLFWTSKVVAIRELTSKETIVETENSIYKLSILN